MNEAFGKPEQPKCTQRYAHIHTMGVGERSSRIVQGSSMARCSGWRSTMARPTEEPRTMPYVCVRMGGKQGLILIDRANRVYQR